MDIKEVRDKLNKKYGPGTVISLGDITDLDIDAVSTGSLKLDKITGVGGLPLGRITEIYGTEGSGKTTICYQTIANAQKRGIKCLYIDVEQTSDLRYMNNLGVNLAEVEFAHPEASEDIMTIAREYIESGTIGFVVVDSIAAMSTKSELEGDIGDAQMGGKARLMGQTLRVLAKPIADHNVGFVMINQIREKLGVMFGSPQTTPGGLAIRHAASLRIQLARTSKQSDQIDVKASITKSKISLPFKDATFTIVLGRGVDVVYEMADLGLEKGLWEKKGAWYILNESNKFQGVESLAVFLRELQCSNPDKFQEYLEICKK